MNINVLEIRNYVLKPHMREHFIDYFEANFIVSQTEINMHVLGQFRLVGEPDHFVWLRGFRDMQARLEALEGFYGSDFWKHRRNMTNSMLIDNDDVHLLRPLGEFDLNCGASAESMTAELAAGTISPQTGVVAIDFYRAKSGNREPLIDAFQTQVMPAYEQVGVQVRGSFIAEMSENTFPRLPVIQNADELVVFTAYESEAAFHEQRSKVAHHVNQTLGSAETLLLHPTLRSALRYVPK